MGGTVNLDPVRLTNRSIRCRVLSNIKARLERPSARETTDEAQHAGATRPSH